MLRPPEALEPHGVLGIPCLAMACKHPWQVDVLGGLLEAQHIFLA